MTLAGRCDGSAETAGLVCPVFNSFVSRLNYQTFLLGKERTVLGASVTRTRGLDVSFECSRGSRVMRESRFVVATTKAVPKTRGVSIKWCYFVTSLPGKRALCATLPARVRQDQPRAQRSWLGLCRRALGLRGWGKRQQCCGTPRVGTLVFLRERDTKGEKKESSGLS